MTLILFFSGNKYCSGKLSFLRTILILIISSLFAFTPLRAQTPSFTWVRSVHSIIDESSTDVAADPVSGDVVMVGSWGSQSLSAFFGASGWAPADFTVSYGNIDGFVAKYTSAGNLVWAFKIGGANSDYVNAVDIDNAGNIYITGTVGVGGPINFSGTAYSIPDNTIPSNPGGTDSFVAKYSSAGLLQWIKYSDGVAGDFVSYDVSVNNSSVYISGSGFGSAKFDPVTFNCNKGGKDVFVARFDLSGTIQWVAIAGSASDDFGNTLIADNSHVYLTGDYLGATLNIYDKTGTSVAILNNTSTSKEDIFFISYSMDGSLNWAKNIGSVQDDQALGLAQDNDYIYMTGGISNGASFPAYSGNPVVATAKKDLFISSFSKSTGNTIWVITVPCNANNDELGTDLELSSTGKIYVTGYFKSVISFPGPTVLSATGSDDIFIACYTNGGSFVWAKRAGAGGQDFGNGIAVDVLDNIFVSGFYNGNATFDLITLPNDNNSENIFLAKIEVPCTDAVGGTAVAGSNSICQGSSTTITLSGYQGTITWQSSPAGLDTWSNLPGETLPLLTVTPLVNTDYRAFLSSGTCLSAYSNIVPVSVLANSVANAGSGGNECDLDFQLPATPSIGTGTWTMTSGTGTASFSPNANDPNAIATVTAFGAKEFTWTEVVGTCSNAAAITVNFYQQPVANAGSGGNECDLDFQLQATPSVGTGTWTMTSGTGTASFSPNANDPNAIAAVTTYGTKQFTWTEVNGTCSNESVVSVTFNQKPVALATANDKECGLTAELVVTPSVGIGLWKKTSGPGNAVFGTTADVTKRSVTVDQYGTYEFTWIETNTICVDSVKIIVTFYEHPSIIAGAGGEVCGLSFNLQAVPSLGNGYWSASTTSSNVIFSPSANDPKARVTVNNYGAYDFIWTESNASCSGSSLVTVTFWEQPSAYAGPDQNLEYQFETSLVADSPSVGKGIWKANINGATISDINDPKSSLSGLSMGENIFTWSVTNGVCIAATDEVVIIVNDIITPTVITPNEDGLNDKLIFPGLSAFTGSSIIIYNRWGSELYRSDDYKNDWKGKDQKGRDLVIDTYYYILKISNGRIIKGFVEIRR